VATIDKGTKTWQFFAHFNRVNMHRKDPNVWTVHFRGTCFQGTDVIFNVPTYTSYKPNRKQPRARIHGRAHYVERVGTELLVG
jgi:hypothetical protein